MKVIVTPNKKVPIRGLLSHPFTDEKSLDLTEMQIKRVLGFDAKVHVVSLDGIKGEITLVNGELNMDAIKTALDDAGIPTGESDHPTNTETEGEIVLLEVEQPDEPVEEKKEDAPQQQHMTKAQRKAARRAEAQQRAAEEAARKEAEAEEESTTDTVEEVETETTEETVVDEDAAKDNAEVIEADAEDSVEE